MITIDDATAKLVWQAYERIQDRLREAQRLNEKLTVELEVARADLLKLHDLIEGV